jgi:hypothetical protein
MTTLSERRFKEETGLRAIRFRILPLLVAEYPNVVPHSCDNQCGYDTTIAGHVNGGKYVFFTGRGACRPASGDRRPQARMQRVSPSSSPSPSASIGGSKHAANRWGKPHLPLGHLNIRYCFEFRLSCFAFPRATGPRAMGKTWVFSQNPCCALWANPGDTANFFIA